MNVDDWLTNFGITSKKDGLPTSTWETVTEEFRRGLIDGLFSSDGHVEICPNRGFARVRLTSAHEKLARDVSDLLGFYGIKTAVRSRARKGKFPNGKDYGKTYTSYEVLVEGTASVEHFARLFRLTHQEKHRRLQSAVGNHKADVESSNVEITSVELTGIREDVWDISVGDDTHCFQLAHCVTGNCLHPKFPELCEILKGRFAKEQRGLWSNHPHGQGKVCRETFDPNVSNLNVHLDREAHAEFKRDWPESHPFGLHEDSRHSPVYTALRDIIPDESERWELISRCDINRHWSAMVCVVPGKGVRAYFCEIAAAQAILHAEDPESEWPDLGLPATPGWWRKPMTEFAAQVEYHCHRCGVPLRGYGELACKDDAQGVEQVSATHEGIYRPKRGSRRVELVTVRDQLREGRIGRSTDYLGNSKR